MSLLIIRTIMGCLLLYKDSWVQANDSRGATGAITLRGLFNLLQFSNLIAALQAIIDQQQSLNTAMRLAFTERDILRAKLHNCISRMHYLVMHHLDPIDLVRLPKVPRPSCGHQELLKACNATLELWQYLLDNPNADLPTPLLVDGTTLVQFTADRDAYIAVYESIITSRNAWKRAKQDRDRLVNNEIKPRLVQYRAKIIALFPKDSQVRVNLPTMSVPRGGAADKVYLDGVWDAVEQVAKLEWTASARTDLLHYEVRACNGTTYQTDNEYQIATVAKDQLTWNTSEGLVATGSTMVFRVYVVTKTLRERGSNNAKVIRTATQTQNLAA
ncbi:MAG: hypothetical protein SFY80_11965 [Verrucomicrobiota bacterium]|nr:hypothetical protein [Verrucomicrobiota bacterium]